MSSWVLSGLDHKERPVVLIAGTITTLVDGEIRTWPFDGDQDVVQWADGSPRMVPEDHALNEIFTVARASAATPEGGEDA